MATQKYECIYLPPLNYTFKNNHYKILLFCVFSFLSLTHTLAHTHNEDKPSSLCPKLCSPPFSMRSNPNDRHDDNSRISINQSGERNYSIDPT